jgi:hypothetical protein
MSHCAQRGFSLRVDSTILHPRSPRVAPYFRTRGWRSVAECSNATGYRAMRSHCAAHAQPSLGLFDSTHDLPISSRKSQSRPIALEDSGARVLLGRGGLADQGGRQGQPDHWGDWGGSVVVLRVRCRSWCRPLPSVPCSVGYRDQLQDMLSLTHVAAARLRSHLAECAAHQFEEGDVLPSAGLSSHLTEGLLIGPGKSPA